MIDSKNVLLCSDSGLKDTEKESAGYVFIENLLEWLLSFSQERRHFERFDPKKCIDIKEHRFSLHHYITCSDAGYPRWCEGETFVEHLVLATETPSVRFERVEINGSVRLFLIVEVIANYYNRGIKKIVYAFGTPLDATDYYGAMEVFDRDCVLKEHWLYRMLLGFQDYQ